MSLTYSAGLAPLVNAATTKKQVSDVLNAQLGTNRTIICKRDPDANANDPWATGTIFRQVGSTGAMNTVSGIIVDFGTVKGTVTATAADIFTGKCVLRIQSSSGSMWVQGSLGPSADAQRAAGITNPKKYDFEADGNFTAKNGFAVRPGLGLSGARWLPSGIGPAAPAKTAGMPHKFILWDYTNASAPVQVGSCFLDNRVDDFTYEHKDMAANIGDAAWYQTTTGIVFGKHWFAPHLFISAASNTIDNSAPLLEVAVTASYKTDTGWTSYPESDTYTKRTDIVFPKPFKIEIQDQNGVQLGMIQMQDGLPINDPSMTSGVGTGYPGWQGKPLRPKFNIGMVLAWRNKQPAFNPYAKHIYPGLYPGYSDRPTVAKTYFTYLSCEPLITDGYSNSGSINGIGSFEWAAKWPQYLAAGQVYQVQGATDPYANWFGLQNSHSPWLEGWGYEPGAFGMHNWYTAPGGPRQDRGPIPSIIAKYINDPTGNRVQESVPWQDMATNWNLNYLNRSNHLMSDPRTLAVDSQFNMMYNWSQMGFYYSNGSEGAQAKRIWWNGDQRGGTDPVFHFDVEGNNIWNAWAQDNLHDYATAAWGAISQKTPMLAVMSKFDYFVSCINHGGSMGSYGVRDWAWQMLHTTLAWIVASRHPACFSQAHVESRFTWQMEELYNSHYVPTWIENNQAPYYAGIRNLGMAITDNGGRWIMGGGGLGFYLGGVLVWMKQSGFWQMGLNKGGHVKIVMEQMIADYDRYCFGFMVTAKGVLWHPNDGYVTWPNNMSFPASGTYVPNNWQDLWNGRVAIASPDWPVDQGQATLFRNTDGTLRGDYDVAQWPMVTYVLMRRDFFPEYDHPLKQQAIDFVVSGMDAKKALVQSWIASGGVNTGPNPDYIYCYPGVAPIKAPDVVGPL
jgi:hypothetical protein